MALEMTGTYLTIILVAAAIVLWPQEVEIILVCTSLKMQLFWMNWRLKRVARKMHFALVKSMTTPLYFNYDFEHGGKGWWEKLNRGWHEMYSYDPPMISPPEFRFTNLWDRKS